MRSKIYIYIYIYIYDANAAGGLMVRGLGQQDFACIVSCIQVTLPLLVSVLVYISLSIALGT